MRPEQSIKSFWDRAAERNPYWYVSSYGSYDADRNLNEFWASGHSIWAELKRVTGYIPESKHTVVEIGCGVGRLTRAIAQDVGKVIALDISDSMPAIARQADLANADFRIAEGFTLRDIPDKSADFVLAYCVFQHLPSYDALRSYITEMHRVSKPGSLMAFTLTPRSRSVWLLPMLRARAYLREQFVKHRGPKGVYQKEWTGIRPGFSVVSEISPIRLEHILIDSERVLYFGWC